MDRKHDVHGEKDQSVKIKPSYRICSKAHMPRGINIMIPSIGKSGVSLYGTGYSAQSSAVFMYISSVSCWAFTRVSHAAAQSPASMKRMETVAGLKAI